MRTNSFIEQQNKLQAVSGDELRSLDHILVDVTNAVICQSSKETLLTSLLERLSPYFPINDLAIVSVVDNQRCVQYTAQTHEGCVAHQRHFFKNASDGPLDFKSDATCVLNRPQLEPLLAMPPAFYLPQGIAQVIFVPLVFRREIVGKIAYMLRDAAPLDVANINLLQQIAARVALGIHSLSHQASTPQLNQSSDIVIEETYEHYQIFDDIISHSEVMNQVLDQVAMVADCDATVLIEGESGTGKELIARAIHKMSRRSHKPMVKMNCAAIPEGLFESELFGHERGAFTGAVKNRVGRFEQAHESTLFLDEIGDLSLELQPKLLRVLQESEIERVGKNTLIPVDVRMVVATNVDLFEMVNKKCFRPDLYYRLNVFPIKLPPLRERSEDIPLLVKHFTRLISRQMGKNIKAIPKQSMQALTAFDWPGNVRQLRNFIERSVILTRGEVLNVPVYELPGMEQMRPQAVAVNVAPKAAPDANDRETILSALRESNGIVAGPRGAAAKLGIKRTTLLSRMQKMGISTKDYLSAADAEQGDDYE